MILGVCAGIAKHFALDPSIVRIGWAFMTVLSGGIGVILYIVLAILLPEEIKKEKAI
ncbi:MAG: PspC domain-containing protein [Calditrichaeota bacterium]|nr:MAG: PspC domain-containing protein [Calditrichota bacterium]